MSRFVFTSDDERVESAVETLSRVDALSRSGARGAGVAPELLGLILTRAASLRYVIRDSVVQFTVHLESSAREVIREQVQQRWACDGEDHPPPDDAQITAWLAARGLDLRYNLTFVDDLVPVWS